MSPSQWKRIARGLACAASVMRRLRGVLAQHARSPHEHARHMFTQLAGCLRACVAPTRTGSLYEARELEHMLYNATHVHAAGGGVGGHVWRRATAQMPETPTLRRAPCCVRRWCVRRCCGACSSAPCWASTSSMRRSTASSCETSPPRPVNTRHNTTKRRVWVVFFVSFATSPTRTGGRHGAYVRVR